MKDIVLILTSHGNMACETLKSAEMITGKIENAYALAMEADDGMLQASTKLDQMLLKVSLKFKHIIIIADLLGGTPCNVAIEKSLNKDNITLLSGFNLTMVIEFAMSTCDDYQKLKKHLIEVGRNAVKDILVDTNNNLNE